MVMDAGLLVYKVEKSVRGAASHKYRPFTRLHDLEKDLLPYFYRDVFHVGSKQ